MKLDMLKLLANELIEARDYWQQWQRTSETKTEWSKAEHLDYGEARARYQTVARCIRMMGLEADVDQIVYLKDIEAFEKEIEAYEKEIEAERGV